MSDSDKQEWLDLTETDLAGWRSLPISQLLIQHLRSELQAALEHIAVCVEEEKTVEAQVTRGGLRVARALLLQIVEPREEKLATVDDTFVDPAALPGKVVRA